MRAPCLWRMPLIAAALLTLGYWAAAAERTVQQARAPDAYLKLARGSGDDTSLEAQDAGLATRTVAFESTQNGAFIGCFNITKLVSLRFYKTFGL